MAVNEYKKGTDVKCTGTFRDEADVLADPTAVFFQVKNPHGEVAVYQYTVDAEVVRSGTGVYYVLVDANLVGEWHYRWYSTGTNKTADEKDFIVVDSEF